MSQVGFRARNHPQQTGRRGALEAVDDRRTPRALWEPLHAEFGFTLDAAATRENAQTWTFDRVWCNPPYSDCGAWVEKATFEMWKGCKLVVMLLPANRTEQRWWQERIEPGRRAGRIEVRFLAGRLRFDVPEGTYADPRGNRPPFGVCLVIWRKPL